MKSKAITEQLALGAEKLADLIIDYDTLARRRNRCKKGGKAYDKYSERLAGFEKDFHFIKTSMEPLLDHLHKKEERWKTVHEKRNYEHQATPMHNKG